MPTKAARKKHPPVKIKKVRSLGPKAPAITKIDPDGLTPKERLFVSEWLIDKNATRAYKAAGYKAKNDNVAAVQAHSLIRKPKISAAMQKAMTRQVKRLEIKADSVLEEWRRIADAKGTDLFRPDGTLKQPHEWDEATAATISGVEHGPLGIVKIKRWSKVEALKQLSNHLRICQGTATVEHTGTVNHQHAHMVGVVELEKLDLSVEVLRQLSEAADRAALPPPETTIASPPEETPSVNGDASPVSAETPAA